MAADAGITKNVSFHTNRHTTQVYADVVMETNVNGGDCLKTHSSQNVS